MHNMLVTNQEISSKICLLFYLMFLYRTDGKKCKFNVQLEQILYNEGFHRNLSINIDFASDNEEEKRLYEDCMVGIEQILPSGVYSSLDEINDNHCKSLIHTIFKTPVNIEMHAEKSEPITIHFLSKVMDFQSHIYVPVNARYHQPITGGGTVRNEIQTPKIYLNCPEHRLNACDNLYEQVSDANNFCSEHVTRKDCSWKEIPAIVVTPPITWDVPVGNTDHYYVVASGTAVVVIVGSLYLLMTIHECKIQVRRKKRKKLTKRPFK